MKNKSKTMIFSFSRFISLLFIQLLMLSNDRLAGQCGSPDLAPTIDCDSAPLICLQNWCYTGLLEANPGHNGYCGPNTTVHNPQYYKFIATDEDVNIDIHVDDCDSGIGLQSAILGACPWDNNDVLSCDPGKPPGTTMYLQVSGFEIGQMGWLLIDGSGGSTCSYTITYTSGIHEPELVGDITLVTATPTATIPGFFGFTVQATPPVAGAHGYAWDREWSDEIITSTEHSTLINVPCEIDPGIYTICVKAFSGCDTTENEICVEIELPEQVEIIKNPSTFCPEAFPFPWFNLTISGPGTYTQSFHPPIGCPIDSIWQVNVNPDSPVASIIQEADTLCTNREGITSYSWFSCQSTEILAFSRCFTPHASGCYCVELENADGCRDTACIDFLISALPELNNDPIRILPVPSTGSWEVLIPDHVQTPITWALVDQNGRFLEQGTIADAQHQIVLDKRPVPGMYYLRFTSQNGDTFTSKVMISNE